MRKIASSILPFTVIGSIIAPLAFLQPNAYADQPQKLFLAQLPSTSERMRRQPLPDATETVPTLEPIPGDNIRRPGALNRRLRDDAEELIDQMEYEHIAGVDPGTLLRGRDRNGLRIDLQNNTAEGTANIQVQVGRSTVAGVLVPANYRNASNAASRERIISAVKNALKRSLDSARNNNGTPRMYSIGVLLSNESGAAPQPEDRGY